jgi:hypothetical protein
VQVTQHKALEHARLIQEFVNNETSNTASGRCVTPSVAGNSADVGDLTTGLFEKLAEVDKQLTDLQSRQVSDRQTQARESLERLRKLEDQGRVQYPQQIIMAITDATSIHHVVQAKMESFKSNLCEQGESFDATNEVFLQNCVVMNRTMVMRWT